MEDIKRWKNPLTFPIIFWIGILLLISFLMFSTLWENDKYIMVHAFIHSDFMVHIPLVQSFYYGGNFHPIEYPLFVGEKINYHYGFHIMAAYLERLGLPFSYAVNILSILGFFLMVFFIYLFTKYISKDKIAPYIAASLPFLDFSLIWYIYLLKHGSHWLLDIPKLREYTCFGPWDGCIVSLFWNFNIYINQRHLALGFALSFLLIYLISLLFYESHSILPKLIVLLESAGVLIALVYIHKGMLIVSLMFWGIYIGIRTLYLIFNWKNMEKIKKREEILNILLLSIGLIVSFLLVLLFLELAYSQFTRPDGLKVIRIYWGFLYRSAKMLWPLKVPNIVKWFIYMLFNLGVLPFFAIIGFILSLKNKLTTDKEILNISLFFLSWAVFIMANIVVFSIDVAINHKFINFSILIWEIYTAYAFVRIFKKGLLGQAVVVVILFFLVFNIFLDYIPIFNNTYIGWEKPNYNPISRWVIEHTRPEDKFLNVTYIVAPLDVAGRRIFFGWDYFAMSAGYDTYGRRREYYSFLDIYKKDPKRALYNLCRIMKKYNLKYLYFSGHDKFIDRKIDQDDIAKTLLSGIKPLYHEGDTYIYSYEAICTKIK